MDYATKYGISEDAAAAQLQIYRRLKAERRVFTDEAAYMDRIFGCGKASSGAPAEESRTKPPATRTLDLAPVVSDEPDAEEKAAEKVGLLRSVFSRVGKSSDDSKGSKFTPPFDMDSVKKAVGQFQSTVVPRAKQAVETVSPYIQEGARQAVVFAKPILAKGAEFGGEAAKQILEFVTQTLLPQILEVVTSTLTQLLSALVSALFSAIGSAVKSALIGDALGDPDRLNPNLHVVSHGSGVFYDALAKLFESADMEDAFNGRRVETFGNEIFCVTDASPETVKNLRGALWMFVHVKPWVTPAEFDQIFIAELVRRNLRKMVFGEPGSPIPFKSGNPIPAGDLQSAFAKAMAERRQYIEPPPEEDNPEPSPFDDEDEQPPPTFSAPPPPPPTVKPPAVTMPKQTAKAIYQSPPPPPPLPPRDPIPAAPALVPASVAAARVGPNAQTWDEIKVELAQYLDPRAWPKGVDYIVSPPWSVQNIDTLLSNPSIPDDDDLLSLAARARSFYNRVNEDQALRKQALQVLAGDKVADATSVRTLEKLTSGFLDDPAMIANMTAYYNTAVQTSTFSTSVLENIIKDTQRQGLKSAGLGLTDAQIDELVASYAPQTKTAVDRLLRMMLRPVDATPVTATVRPEVSMAVAQVADTMAPYIPSEASKPSLKASGIGGFGMRISNLIAQTGGAFGKVTTDLLASPEIRNVVSDVTRVATETASQAIVSAGKDAITSATRVRTPEEIMEADRLKREAASARATVQHRRALERKREAEAKAAKRKADAAAKTKPKATRSMPQAKTKPAKPAKPAKAPKTKPMATRSKTKIGLGMTEQEYNMSIRGDLVADVEGGGPMVLWTKRRAGSHAVFDDSDSDDDDEDDAGATILRLAYSRHGPERVVLAKPFDSLAVPRSILAAYKDPAFWALVEGQRGVSENGPFVVWNPIGEPMSELGGAVDTYVEDMANGLHLGSPLDTLFSRKKAAPSGGAASLRAWSSQSSPEDNQPGSAGTAAVVSAFIEAARDPKAKLMPTDIAARVKTVVYMLMLSLERLSTVEKPGGTKFSEKFPLLNNGLELFSSVTEMAAVDSDRAAAGALFGKKDASEKAASPAPSDVLGKNVGVFLFTLVNEIVKSGMQDRYYDLADEAVRAALGSKGTVNDKSLQRALRLMSLFAATVKGFLVEPDFAKAAVDGVVHVLISPSSMLDSEMKGDLVRARLEGRAPVGDLLEYGAYEVATAHGRLVAKNLAAGDTHFPSVHVFVPLSASKRLVFRNNRTYRDGVTVISGHRQYGQSSIPHHRMLSGESVDHSVDEDGGSLHAAAELFGEECDATRRRTFAYKKVKMVRVGTVPVFVNTE